MSLRLVSARSTLAAAATRRAFCSAAGAEGAKQKRPKWPHLHDIIKRIPRPEGYVQGDKSTYRNKNGQGLRFTRKQWRERHLDEAGNPTCYWTVTRFKPSLNGARPKAFGKWTWRGVESEKEELVKRPYKREWTLVQTAESQWVLEHWREEKQARLAAEAAEAEAEEAAEADEEAEAKE